MVPALLDGEVGLAKTDLTAPSPENSLPHLLNAPQMGILIEKSPLLQDINLVEPLFEYLPLLEQVESGEDLKLKISVTLNLVHISFPSGHYDLLAHFLEVLETLRLDGPFAISEHQSLFKTAKHLFCFQNKVNLLYSAVFKTCIPPSPNCFINNDL